jgi:phospholipid/cholesterol/gamma-HCH transport system substrate-binding protein
MEAKREQAMVGVFVLVAAGLLLATTFALSGAFRRGDVSYRAYFKFAAGLEPGAAVRYAGGPQIGRIATVHADPQDTSRMEINFTVQPDTPVKTDSRAKISSLSALGENFLEIVPGTVQAAPAPPGSVLASSEYVSLDDLTAKLNDLAPVAQNLLKQMTDRVSELHETIARVNDSLSPENRRNIAASLGQVRGMLEEDRPRVTRTLGNVEAASARLTPLLDDFKKTVAQANEAISHVDATLMENRLDVRKAVQEMRQALASAAELTGRLDQILDYNSDDIDDILENMRHVAENLKQFTETIKTRPYTLIRSASPPARTPGAEPKP